MKKILDQIKAYKIEEVLERKQRTNLAKLQSSPLFNRKTYSMRHTLTQENSKGIIAEFKRQSPSKGPINLHANIESVTAGYQHAGASAVSILYDQHFFGALPNDFELGRAQLTLPVLQKDFIVDDYQIAEAKAIGADVILLIAKMLTVEQVKRYTDYAHQLGLEVFLETQNEAEITAHQSTEFDLIGINNRNLQSFTVDTANSIALAKLLPATALKIAESGLDSAEDILTMKNNGFTGFLIGEYFMRAADPAQQLHALIQKL